MTHQDNMTETGLEVQRHDTMYLASSTGITAICFITTIFYAHLVGPAVLGAYFIFLSSFNIPGLFTDLGIGTATTQQICGGKDLNEYFSANMIPRIGLYLLVCIIAILIRDRFGDLNTHSLFWLLLVIFGVSTFSSCLSIAVAASTRLGLLAFVSLLNNIMWIVVKIVMVFLGFQVYGLIGCLLPGLLMEFAIQAKYIDYYIRKFE